MTSPSGEQLWEIFSRSFRANPRAYANHQRAGEEWENTPVYDMLESSPALNLLRQYLPRALGGYSAEERQSYGAARRGTDILPGDLQLQRNSLERGYVPIGEGREVPTPGPRAAAAQAAGALSADVVADGARNIWWFLNAPQALASLAIQQAMATSSPDLKAAAGVSPQVPWLKNRNLRMAATAPAWIAMSLGIGNLARQPGYKAVVPDEEDPTQSANLLQEGIERYFLGRTGALLPYDEFVQERPDVSRSEYESYKAYLFGSNAPLKATLEGIHGPEVTFMGKSIPVATTILPAVAAIAGTRYGVRRAAQALSGLDRKGQPIAGAPNRLEQAEEARLAWRAAEPKAKDDAYQRYARRQDANEAALLKGALAYGGGATATAAATGQALELLRRTLDTELPSVDPLEPV
jgi:hypothetical protein